MQQKQDDTNNLVDKINEFIQRNRKILFISIGTIIVLFAGLIIFLTLSNRFQRNSIAEVEVLVMRHSELRFQSNYDAAADELLAELRIFAERNSRWIFSFGPGVSGFASGRAWSLMGQIYSDRNDFYNAELAWHNAAKTASRTYLAPMAYFNAAIAAEEQGKLETAIEYYQNSIDSKFAFPAAPRAQFSIGRLYEQLMNYPAAIEAYRQVLINWPAVTNWANLAQSRIIAIEIK